MIRPVVRLPAAGLARRCREVGEIDETALALAADLVDTMRASPACVGLAANQIGVDLRCFAVDVTGHRKARSQHGLIVLFDPEIIAAGDPHTTREGCMSVPDLTGDVARARDVVVRGLDPEGKERVVRADEFEARAVLHELDHLDGLLFLDRITNRDGIFPRRVYR